ncbi:hypothetical protein J4G43_004985 [Bradyrhizobium barranii subsp. barranii]|uniref:Uncharacterized protein n=1 Tax=Bradyrhizobium barranii subsp. barranii TaxID=2823807 RepID=A0A939M4U4_9BRAD|nr:hypothetical protein [Bradyrhizobium barranii]UEM13678.1 hypothetical protein J4G43_004985 [Bradyrhizobium barranii subsp. barranii]
MNAYADVAAVAAHARHPELTELERQLREANAELDAANNELAGHRDRLQFRSVSNPMSDEQRCGAQRRVEELNATIGALRKTALDLHRGVEAIRPDSVKAVAEALEPARALYAADIAAAREALYAAVGRYNAIMTTLAKEGSHDKELPRSIPVLDAIVAETERVR